MFSEDQLLKLCAPKCRQELQRLLGYEPHPLIFYPESPAYRPLLCEEVTTHRSQTGDSR